MNGQQLQDKVIFITGVAGKLGKSAANLFLKRGAIVIGSDILSLEQSEELVKLKEVYGNDRFLYISADVSQEKQVKDVFLKIDEKFGRLDGVFHNAYKQTIKPMLDLSLDEWNEVIRGSLTSTFLINKYAIPFMAKSEGGAIVNTSSVLSQKPLKENVAYGAAKAGINQLTRIVALEHAEDKIRSNVLLPGDFKSEEQLALMSLDELEAFNDRFLLKRTGAPEEMAEMAAFLLSDAASYVTGSLMTVDGGFSL